MKGKLLGLLILVILGTAFVQAQVSDYQLIEPYKPEKPVEKPVEKPAETPVKPQKAAPPPPKPAPPAPVYASHALLNMVNQARAEAGLPRLQESAVLNQSALLKSQDMVNKNYWSHSPDITVFFRQAGASYGFMGENLARCFGSFNAALTGWLNSPTHYNVMMSNKYTHFGIGIVHNPKDNCDYVTNHFGG